MTRGCTVAEVVSEIFALLQTAVKGAVTAAEKLFVPSSWLEQAKEDSHDVYRDFMAAWNKVCAANQGQHRLAISRAPSLCNHLTPNACA